MVRYIHDLMILLQDEIAAGSAMTLAFQDKRLETWTVALERDRIQVSAALTAAAGLPSARQITA